MGKKGKTNKKDKKNKNGRFNIPKPGKVPGAGQLVVMCIMIPIFWPVSVFIGVDYLTKYWNHKKLTDYHNYAIIIGERSEIRVRELADKTGKQLSLVANDIQTMINKGYLGENAYLDRATGVLVVDALEVEFVDDDGVVLEADWEETPAEEETVVSEPEPETVSEPVPEPAWREDDFDDRLREIRSLNDQIDDEAVSARIDRIGELTASIIEVVRQKPDRADEVRKFMNYYLPTTFKLLKSYSLMEKQSYQGENIVASRRKIEDILDTLIGAFEQQQDRLFRTEAMDVEADIEVLETMMAKDGLTPGGLDLRAMAAQKGIGLKMGDD